MGKHYWREILPKVLEMKTQGYTHQEIANALGYTYEQIRELVHRYHRSSRRATPAAVKRGRPRVRPISSEEEYKKRIKQLEMENELLRSFLQTVGRM